MENPHPAESDTYDLTPVDTPPHRPVPPKSEVSKQGEPCPQCGYDLRGRTSIKCPECGTTIPRGFSTRSGPPTRNLAAETALLRHIPYAALPLVLWFPLALLMNVLSLSASLPLTWGLGIVACMGGAWFAGQRGSEECDPENARRVEITITLVAFMQNLALMIGAMVVMR